MDFKVNFGYFFSVLGEFTLRGVRLSENKIVDVSILTTGGTIEKTYDEQDGILDNRESIIKNILLSRLRLPYTRLNIVPILCKDSLKMNEDDRAFLLLMNKKETFLDLRRRQSERHLHILHNILKSKQQKPCLQS